MVQSRAQRNSACAEKDPDWKSRAQRGTRARGCPWNLVFFPKPQDKDRRLSPLWGQRTLINTAPIITSTGHQL